MKIWCILLSMLCGLLANNANAERWIKVVDSKTSRIFVDTDSINRIGDIVSAWYMRDFVRPIRAEKNHQRYQSSKVLSYYNCTEREVAHAQWITYVGRNATGKVISYEKVMPLQYADITADDAGEPVFNFICKQPSGKK